MRSDRPDSVGTKRGIMARTIAIFAMALLCAGPAAAAERIALLVSADDAPYKEAVAGFHEYLARSGLQPTYELFSLGGDATRAGAAIQKIKQNGFNLVFSLGSLATDAASREISDIPIVAGLVLRADTLKKAPNLTGVGLDVPVDIQLSWIQKIMPQARTVGVVYNSEENKKKIEAASRAAQKLGLTLEAQEVRTAQDVPDALERLAKRTHVLWGLTDNIVMSPQMARPILLFSLQNSIPVIGPSAMWVKAGALYSLDGDYKDLGAQCGEMAVNVLKGATPGTIPIASPRTIRYSLNMNTARQMKLAISDDIVRGAKQTF